MIKFLVSSTNEMRLESMDDVEQFHKQIQEEAEQLGCTLATFSWAEKYNKKLDETYYQVKYKFIFNKLADPDYPLDHIDYIQKSRIVEE